MHNKNEMLSFTKKFLICLLICLGGGWLTGLLTEHSVRNWYPLLIKPSGTPPNILFPIMWTLLYTLMAVSLTLLWTSPTKHKSTAYLFFGIQLLLNFIWSYLFFYLENPALGLIDVTILWIFIVVTTTLFWRHSHLASFLFIPYILWVSYAWYLNLFIWLYNG